MDSVVRGGNWYFGNLNLWRVLDEVNVGELNFETSDFAPGGHMMAVAWPEGLSPIKPTIKTRTDDARLRGLIGRQPGDWIDMTYYENVANYRTGEQKGRIIILKGLLNSVKPDARKGLKEVFVEYEMSTIVTYHDIFDGRSVHRFDYFAGPGATLINGVNPFAGMAANLALAGGTVL